MAAVLAGGKWQCKRCRQQRLQAESGREQTERLALSNGKSLLCAMSKVTMTEGQDYSNQQYWHPWEERPRQTLLPRGFNHRLPTSMPGSRTICDATGSRSCDGRVLRKLGLALPKAGTNLNRPKGLKSFPVEQDVLDRFGTDL